MELPNTEEPWARINLTGLCVDPNKFPFFFVWTIHMQGIPWSLFNPIVFLWLGRKISEANTSAPYRPLNRKGASAQSNQQNANIPQGMRWHICKYLPWESKIWIYLSIIVPKSHMGLTEFDPFLTHHWSQVVGQWPTMDIRVHCADIHPQPQTGNSIWIAGKQRKLNNDRPR